MTRLFVRRVTPSPITLVRTFFFSFTMNLGHLTLQLSSSPLAEQNSISLDACFPWQRCPGGNVYPPFILVANLAPNNNRPTAVLSFPNNWEEDVNSTITSQKYLHYLHILWHFEIRNDYCTPALKCSTRKHQSTSTSPLQ